MLSIIKQTVEGHDPRLGRIFNTVIQFLIVISLISFSVDTLPNLSLRVEHALDIVEAFTVGIFTLEYLLRILVADRKWRFIFSFFGIVDLVAILPFYLTTGLDLRSVRALSLLRLFKFLRYY
jgi:voltage-gated potassium channel